MDTDSAHSSLPLVRMQIVQYTMNLTSGTQAEFEIPAAQRQPLVQLYVLCKQMLGQQITRRELGLEKEKLERAPLNQAGLGPGPASNSGLSGAGVVLPGAPSALPFSDGGSGIRENTGDASDVSAPSLTGAALVEGTVAITTIECSTSLLKYEYTVFSVCSTYSVCI